MRVDEEEPEVRNGWLIAGQKPKYSNSPIIKISKIEAITYYPEKKYDDGRVDYDAHVMFQMSDSTLKWQYDDNETMYEDYYSIVNNVIIGKTDIKVRDD